ncbi:hypothetical protein [Poriferisphaera sp. WC338]|uniref:hypothetical protein n=1 Tax=Poriferisphaera sp. WC338 TaxID=3425129 RepID=UPI003D81B060
MPDEHTYENTPEQPVEIRSLCPEDADALDAIIENRANCSDLKLSDHDPQRAEQMASLLSILDAYPEEPAADDLAARTMAHIQQARQRERFAEQVQMLSQPARSLGVSWRQIVSAAAVFILGVSLLFPVLQHNRNESQRIAGQANLAGMGSAISQYANDNNLALPALSVNPGSIWWNVGQTSQNNQDQGAINSNSAHLYLLARHQYLKPEEMICPANVHAPVPGSMTTADHDWKTPQAVSFSYQNQYGRIRLRINHNPNMIILADKNPRFKINLDTNTLTFDPRTSPAAVSRAHQSRGQNVLNLGGNVTWTTSSVVTYPNLKKQDNIYNATGIETYTGTETPTEEHDSFLVP